MSQNSFADAIAAMLGVGPALPTYFENGWAPERPPMNTPECEEWQRLYGRTHDDDGEPRCVNCASCCADTKNWLEQEWWCNDCFADKDYEDDDDEYEYDDYDDEG